MARGLRIHRIGNEDAPSGPESVYQIDIPKANVSQIFHIYYKNMLIYGFIRIFLVSNTSNSIDESDNMMYTNIESDRIPKKKFVADTREALAKVGKK